MFQCSETFEPDDWSLEVSDTGFVSSPRTADLNADGVLDLVVGGGGEEFVHAVNGVLAIDGRTGEIIWSVPARNQVVGSPIFLDVNGDEVPEVFIGGRSAVFLAIDGRSGRVFWEYLPDADSMDLLGDPTLLNFFSAQSIPDTDDDGLDDLIVSFGGFIQAKAGDRNRPPGQLIVMSSRDGSVLERFFMPDGAETYFSPLVYDFRGDGSLSVIFGTGGETLNGHLYRIALADLLAGKQAAARVLASGNGKGFIAGPVLADINQDGTWDIIAHAVNGRLVCIDGRTDREIWSYEPGTHFEVYTTPAPGYFGYGDDGPDFFCSMGAGPWPDTEFTRHVVIDGKTGKEVFEDTLGLFQYASPVVLDFDEDGFDDVLLATNDRRVLPEISQTALFYVNDLKVLNLRNGEVYNLGNSRLGANLGTTPLITDLDGDGRIDIIYCYMEDANNFYSFRKGRIERRELHQKVETALPWGEFMGKRQNGTFILR